VRLLLLATSLCLTMGLGGCASSPDTVVSDARDPYENTNRKIFAFNMKVDDVVLEPAAKGYRKLPALVRAGVTNHVEWTSYPSTTVNSAFQGKFENAALASIHFLMNGLTLGFVDLTEDTAPEQEDFGQTLAGWNAPEGPFVMMPLLGPGTVRSHTGFVVDALTNPLSYLGEPMVDTIQQVGVPAGAVTFRSNNFDQINDVKYNSIDPYAVTRSVYYQYRSGEIRNGDTSAESEADAAFDRFLTDDAK